MKFTFSCLLLLTKFGLDWSSSSWEGDVNAWRTTHDDGRQTRNRSDLFGSRDLKNIECVCLIWKRIFNHYWNEHFNSGCLLHISTIEIKTTTDTIIISIVTFISIVVLHWNHLWINSRCYFNSGCDWCSFLKCSLNHHGKNHHLKSGFISIVVTTYQSEVHVGFF